MNARNMSRRLIGALLVAGATLGDPRGAGAQVIGWDPVVLPPGSGVHEPPERRPPRRPPPPATIPDDGICHPCTDPPNFIAPPPNGACYMLRDGLDNGADCDWLAFPVLAGRHYRMTFCGAGASADADMVLRLFDSSCRVIASNDDACVGGLSQISWDAWVDEVWRLQIANAQINYPNPTIYNLCVTELGAGCDSCARPNPTALYPTPDCQSISDQTGPTAACNYDYYLVFMEFGATYRFSMCPAPAPLPPDPTCAGDAPQAAGACDPAMAWNPRMEIYALPASCTLGTELTIGAIGSGGCASNVQLPDFTFMALATGYYELSIGRENPASSPALCPNYGSYTLAYQRLSVGCATCAAGPYVNGAVPLVPTPACQDISGVIDSCADEWIELALSAGVAYEFTTCDIPGGCTTGAAQPATVLTMMDPTCALVLAQTNLSNACSPTGTLLLFTPATTDVYRARVTSANGAPGPYTLTYREAP